MEILSIYLQFIDAKKRVFFKGKNEAGLRRKGLIFKFFQS